MLFLGFLVGGNQPLVVIAVLENILAPFNTKIVKYPRRHAFDISKFAQSCDLPGVDFGHVIFAEEARLRTFLTYNAVSARFRNHHRTVRVRVLPIAARSSKFSSYQP